MTKQEAEIILLKDALVQAQHTVSFLHSCLVNPSNGEMNGGFHYAYPEQTLKRLREWQELAPDRQPCHHSRRDPDCPCCREAIEEMRLLVEARRVVAESPGIDKGKRGS
jgi:hypothetical protein